MDELEPEDDCERQLAYWRDKYIDLLDFIFEFLYDRQPPLT